MIEAITGLPGSGKTLFAVKRALAARKQRRRVMANFHSRTGAWDFALWDEMIDADNCLVMIDEAHMWFSARNWQKNDQTDLARFQQHRKEGLDIVWIAQHESRVDVAVRELTAYIWRCKKLGRFALVRKYTPDDLKRSLGRVLFPITSLLYSQYFTEETIGFRDGTGYKLGGGALFRRNGETAQLVNGQLMPNLYRVYFPNEHVVWTNTSQESLGATVTGALSAWASFGLQMDPEDVVRGVYRNCAGRMHELGKNGEIVATGETLDALRHAQAIVDARHGRKNPMPAPDGYLVREIGVRS